MSQMEVGCHMGLGAGTANPNPGRTPHKPALPETRSPVEKTLLSKAMGKGGRGRKALKM